MRHRKIFPFSLFRFGLWMDLKKRDTGNSTNSISLFVGEFRVSLQLKTLLWMVERSEQSKRLYLLSSRCEMFCRGCVLRNFSLRLTVRPGVAQENNKNVYSFIRLYVIHFCASSPGCPMTSKRPNASYFILTTDIERKLQDLLHPLSACPWTWNSSSGKWNCAWSLRRTTQCDYIHTDVHTANPQNN